MTQVPKPMRVSKVLLLVAVLLAPAFAGMPALANAATCRAVIVSVSASPLYASPGDSITVTVQLDDANSIPDPEADFVNVEVKANFNGQAAGTAFNSGQVKTQITSPQGSGAVRTFTFPVPSGAATGKGDITVNLFAAEPTNCSLGPAGSGIAATWGFWVGQHPDLVIPEVSFVPHIANDEVNPAGHQQTLSDRNFTRYDSFGASCQEETADFPGTVHFRVKVRNNGSAPFQRPGDGPIVTTNAAAVTDLPAVLRVEDLSEPDILKRVVYHKAVNLTLGPNGGEVDRLITDVAYSLRLIAGPRDLRFTIDATNAYNETAAGEANNVFKSVESSNPLVVSAPDFVGAVSVSVATDGALSGSFNMTNAGTKRGGATPGPTESEPGTGVCHSKANLGVTARVYVGKVDKTHEVPGANITQTLNKGQSTPTVSIPPGFKVPAGVHDVILVLDDGNVTTELNETNNKVVVNVTVADLHAPQVSNVTIAGDRAVGAKINISGDVADDADFTNVTHNVVTINITYPNATALTFGVVPVSSGDVGLMLNSTTGSVRFWYNASYDLSGNYTFTVKATDGSNKTGSAGPFNFDLGVFNRTATMVSVEPCTEQNPQGSNQTLSPECLSPNQPPSLTQRPGKVFGNATDAVRIIFRVPPGSTGLPGELNNTARKTVELRDPDDVVLGNFSVRALCANNQASPPTVSAACGAAPQPCSPTSFGPCFDGMFDLYYTPALPSVDMGHSLGGASCAYSKGSGEGAFRNLSKPGPYNITIWVGDAGCNFQAWNATERPRVAYDPDPSHLCPCMTFELWDLEPAVVQDVQPSAQSTSINALSSLIFSANVTDNYRVKEVSVEIKNASGGLVAQPVLLLNAPTNGTTASGFYRQLVATGAGTPLDRAGAYSWRIIAKDANHSLTASPTRTLTVVDRLLPNLRNESSAFVDGTPVPNNTLELGTPFKLIADVEDDTRLSVVGIVQSAAGSELRRLNMTLVGSPTGHRYLSDASVATGTAAGELPAGTYRVVVQATDAASPTPNTVTSLARTLVISTNLGPSFALHAPANASFGPANGTVSVDVVDNTGIDTAGFAVRYGVNTPGAAGTLVSNPVRSTLTLNGTTPTAVRVSFPMPAEAAHGDTVTVSVEAKDTGGLVTSTTWSFKLDALSPQTTLSCAPSAPAGCLGTLVAVRPDTRFNLTALDPDPLDKGRSGVAAITYVVESTGPSQAVEVPGSSASFLVRDHVAQAGAFNLRYRAVDAAGNREAERTLRLSLDNEGPQVLNVFVTPTASGLTVNATISDASSDVASVKLFSRTGATGFTERPMTRLAGTTWTGLMPGAPRGAQVCYYLEAVDALGNLASNGTANNPQCRTSENHPPQLTVLSPREREDVEASMTVRWQVSDLDNDPVSVALSYRRSTDAQLVPVQVSIEEQGSRSKILDVSAFGSGSYVLRVEATDNQAFNNRTVASVNFTIGGGNVSLARPTLDRTTTGPGEPVRVRVEVDRAASEVEAVLRRGATEVDVVFMEQNPPGSRFWEASFRVTEPGTYSVLVRGTYQDGTPFSIQAASPLTVTGGIGLGALDAVLIVGLGAAVVALGALGLRRRGWL